MNREAELKAPSLFGCREGVLAEILYHNNVATLIFRHSEKQPSAVWCGYKGSYPAQSLRNRR
jgi:hypothetical protein